MALYNADGGDAELLVLALSLRGGLPSIVLVICRAAAWADYLILDVLSWKVLSACMPQEEVTCGMQWMLAQPLNACLGHAGRPARRA